MLLGKVIDDGEAVDAEAMTREHTYCYAARRRMARAAIDGKHTLDVLRGGSTSGLSSVQPLAQVSDTRSPHDGARHESTKAASRGRLQDRPLDSCCARVRHRRSE